MADSQNGTWRAKYDVSDQPHVSIKSANHVTGAAHALKRVQVIGPSHQSFIQHSWRKRRLVTTAQLAGVIS